MDNSKDMLELDKKDNYERDEKVTYLSQGFVTQLCSEEQVAKLQVQIENVIYQKVKDEEKAIYSDFKSFKKSQLDSINLKRTQIRKQLQTISSEIKDTLGVVLKKSEVTSEISKKENEYEKIKTEIEKLSESITKKSQESKKLLGSYNSLNAQKVKLEKENATVAEQIRNLDELTEEYRNFEGYLSTTAQSINRKLKTLGVKEQLMVTISPDNLIDVLKKAKEKLKNSIKNKAEKLKQLNTQISRIIAKLQLEKSRQQKLTELTTVEKKTNQEIASLKATLRKCFEAHNHEIVSIEYIKFTEEMLFVRIRVPAW